MLRTVQHKVWPSNLNSARLVRRSKFFNVKARKDQKMNVKNNKNACAPFQ